MHTRVNARVRDDRGESAEHDREARQRSSHCSGERESGRRVSRGKRARRRHRHPSPRGHARGLPVRARAPARELHRPVHERGVDAQRQCAGYRSSTTGTPAEHEQRARDSEPQLRVVRTIRQPPERFVERRGRRARDRSIHSAVHLSELMKHRRGGRAAGRRPRFQSSGEAFLRWFLRSWDGLAHALMVSGYPRTSNDALPIDL